MHADLTASTLTSFERDVVAPAMAEGTVTWFGGSGRMPPAYRYSNGSTINVGGLDRPGKLLSTEYDRVFIDEADQVSAAAVQVITTRLRGNAPTYKQLLLACNPSAPNHHLKLMADEGRSRHITSLHADNPRFMNADGTPTTDGVDYLAKLDSLVGVARARYRDGKWVSAEGVVWPGWSDAAHQVDPFPTPAEDYRFIESVDFGFQHPMTWGRFAIDGDGRMFLIAEMSRRQRLVEDFARDILELREANGWARPEALVTDHAAGDRATLERYMGEATTAARKAVGSGVQAVAQRLVVQPDGKPRFRVFRTSLVRNDPLAAMDKLPRGFVAEVNGYVWATERGADGVPKEFPKKVGDDSCDMVRYAVMYEDGAAPAKLGNPARGPVAEPQRDSPWSRPVGR